jgi:predicted PurR-regulated permease PerM
VLTMAPTDQGKIVPPAGEPEEHPPPSDPKSIFLGGLFVLALLATAFVAREIVLPLVFAIVLKLLLQPALRVLERLHIPRLLAALLLILGLFGTVAGLGTAISGPARTWAAKLPDGIPRLEERLSFMRVPINALQVFLQQVEDIGGTEPAPNGAVTERGAALLTMLFTGTRNFASGFFTTVLFLFFLLVSGDIFLHRLVEILPHFSSKRQVVEISRQIEYDISAYLVTITIMNAAVGIVMALAVWLTGVGDPILWGTVAFLLNYVPILGTALGVLIFLLAGLLTIDTPMASVAPRRALRWIASDRRTDLNADASGQTFHPESRPCRHLARLLVLDVGYPGRDPVCAHAGDYQDHLRSYSAAGCIRSFS